MDALKKTSISQKIIIFAIVALTIVLIAVVGYTSSQVNYGVLFSGLTDAEVGTVYAKLQELNIDVKSEGANTLLVPVDQVQTVKNQLYADGVIPASQMNGGSGTTDYGSLYMQNGMAFGATDKDKALMNQFQQQTTLTEIINKLANVENSTVMLNLATTTQFALDENAVKESTATVMVQVKPGATFTEEDATAIKTIVSGAVPKMSPENVFVVDQNNNVYGSDGVESGSGAVANQIKLQQQTANVVKNQIVNLLSPVFGLENISAAVNVQLDFDKQTTESITLTPPTDVGGDENKGIITSSKQIAEMAFGNQDAAGVPGMDANGGAPTYQQAIDNINNTDYYTIQEEYNYEVNEVKDLIEKAQGDITNISATVLLNGGDEIANVVENVRQQVATAAGIPVDNITVAPMTFAQNTLMQQQLDEQKAAVEAAQRNQLIQTLIPYAAIIGVILLVVVLILNSIKRKKEMELEAQRLQWMREQAEREANMPLVDVVADEDIDISDIMDQEKNSTLGQLQSLVQKNPDAIAQILRNWLMEDYRR